MPNSYYKSRTADSRAPPGPGTAIFGSADIPKGRGLDFCEDNPMNQDRVAKQLANIRAALRCGAKTRAGTPCRCPAIRGRTRCRIHGGLSTGAPRGERNGNFKNGYWTSEAVQERRWVKQMVQLYAKGTDE
jgi:hypothetical protein